jgi:hypothetical protein
MTLYEFLRFVHILAAAIWFGSGFLLHIQAYRASGDDAGLKRVLDDSVALSTGLFIPSSLAGIAYFVTRATAASPIGEAAR